MEPTQQILKGASLIGFFGGTVYATSRQNVVLRNRQALHTSDRTAHSQALFRTVAMMVRSLPGCTGAMINSEG